MSKVLQGIGSVIGGAVKTVGFGATYAAAEGVSAVGKVGKKLSYNNVIHKPAMEISKDVGDAVARMMMGESASSSNLISGGVDKAIASGSTTKKKQRALPSMMGGMGAGNDGFSL